MKIIQLLNIIFLIIFLNTGCTYKNTVEIDKKENGECKKFDGLKKLSISKNNTIVFYMHGMGEHESNETKTIEFSNNIAQEMNFYSKPSIKSIFILDNKNKQYITTLSKDVNKTNIIGDATILSYFGKDKSSFTFVSLSWSRFMDAIENSLSNQTNKNSNYIAPINKKLKKFMNTGFGDAILYMNNQHKEKIQQIIARLIIKTYELKPKIKTRDHILISTSLGSKLLFDIVKEYNQKKLSTKNISILKNFIKHTKQIFMTSNQLALFNLYEKNKDLDNYQDILSRVDQIVSRTRDTKNNSKKLSIVAFTDPNDVLGYYIPNKITYKNIDFINVLVSNTKIWYLGIFANPIEAHEGIKTEEYGYKAIVNGSSYFKFKNCF